MDILLVRQDLVSFHGDERIKEKYLARVSAHRLADEIVQGLYWTNGKGCAVGCTLHSANHWSYEDELGIPAQFAFIQDGIFERLSKSDAKNFPERFLEAIPVGADLYPALWKFMLFALLDEENGLIAINENKKAIRLAASFYQKAIDGEDIDQQEYLAAFPCDLPSTRIVEKVLDALYVLTPPAAYCALEVLDDLAILDNERAKNELDTWDAVDMFDHSAAYAARAAVWRDKLLECLSRAEKTVVLSTAPQAMAASA